ncbi:DegT/DnrJ/EryC1/StrS family aminotransferase [Benzoatithermus flavus]|uniref:DegT/DnrJ/EryC1/StrS family aminotransferase n=1 Tax=Benzoatithermus flavus TaxID=3108223 RepID=A0ABU8XPH9_9PROT
MHPVPQADPRISYLAHKEAIDAAVARVLASGWYVLGEEVAAFEREFAAFVAAGHGIGVGSGTDAIALILRGLGIGPGDRVATVSHTAVASVAAIEMVGAAPVLIDIEPQAYTMDPGDLAAALAADAEKRIKAVMPVHLYGQPAAMDAIGRLCREHGCFLIEDASQAHGAALDGTPVGGFGIAAAWSLYPTKNLGAIGDAGIVTTSDPALAERLRALRQYGWRRRYVSDEAGVNSRLDELQAAILRVKLARLAAGNARRQAIAARYDAALAGGPFAPPSRRAGAVHVFHQYVIRCPNRDAVQARLHEAGIGTNVHYPVPVHRQPAYAGRVALGPAACRESERAAREVLSLPMFPELDDRQVERVCAALSALRRG